MVHSHVHQNKKPFFQVNVVVQDDLAKTVAATFSLQYGVTYIIQTICQISFKQEMTLRINNVEKNYFKHV